MKAKFPTLPKHVRFSVTGGASPWVTLRLHCQGTRCQSFSREQGNIARAETSGTKGFRGNIVGKSINQERPSCPTILRIFQNSLHVKKMEYALHVPCDPSTSATTLGIPATTTYGGWLVFGRFHSDFIGFNTEFFSGFYSGGFVVIT